jgi:hypothetical protein
MYRRALTADVRAFRIWLGIVTQDTMLLLLENRRKTPVIIVSLHHINQVGCFGFISL